MSLPSQQNSTGQQENAVRGTEVFVGGLPRSISEEKLHKVFSVCGEIVELRLMKDKKGNLKGFCFVRFKTKDSAARAVREISGTVLEGKQIAVSQSSEQNTLYIGNLHKAWSAEEFERIILQVFPDIESVDLPMLKDTPTGQKQRNRGFAFVKFRSHAAASRAHRVGSQPDFRLMNLHPSVNWAEEKNEIDPSEQSKIKVAFVRNLPLNTEEYYLNQLFEPFGEIEKVVVSNKSTSAVGFVHFVERSDLERAIEELSEKSVQGPNGGPAYKLEVEIARPMERNKKRVRENYETTFVQDHFKHSKPNIQSSLVQREIESADDPYEEAVLALPLPVKERLLRILRLNIATRVDIDAKSLCSLKELPEPYAIAVLDQFMISAATLPNKGEYLDGLIYRHMVEKTRSNRSAGSFSRVAENSRSESRSFRISHQVSPPHTAPPFTSHAHLTAARHNTYNTHYVSPHSDYLLPSRTQARPSDEHVFSDYSLPTQTLTRRADETGPLDYPLSSRALTRQAADRSPLLPHNHSISGAHNAQIPNTHTLDERAFSPYESRQVGLRTKEMHPHPMPSAEMVPRSSISHRGGHGLVNMIFPDDDRVGGGRYQESTRPQVRFDPFTGEPYKFDPFTGEPIIAVNTEPHPF